MSSSPSFIAPTLGARPSSSRALAVAWASGLLMRREAMRASTAPGELEDPVHHGAAHGGGVALDLHQVEGVVAEDERVDLVAAPGGVRERDEGPQPVGLRVREGLLDELDGLLLVGVGRHPLDEDAVLRERHDAVPLPP